MKFNLVLYLLIILIVCCSAACAKDKKGAPKKVAVAPTHHITAIYFHGHYIGDGVSINGKIYVSLDIAFKGFTITTTPFSPTQPWDRIDITYDSPDVLMPSEVGQLVISKGFVGDDGYQKPILYATLYNGTDKKLESVTIIITVKVADGTVKFTREYALRPYLNNKWINDLTRQQLTPKFCDSKSDSSVGCDIGFELQPGDTWSYSQASSAKIYKDQK